MLFLIFCSLRFQGTISPPCKGGKVLLQLAKYLQSYRQLKLYPAEYFLLRVGFIDYVADGTEALCMVKFKASGSLVWCTC